MMIMSQRQPKGLQTKISLLKENFVEGTYGCVTIFDEDQLEMMKFIQNDLRLMAVIVESSA